jgi:hypothetical protein
MEDNVIWSLNIGKVHSQCFWIRKLRESGLQHYNAFMLKFRIVINDSREQYVTTANVYEI